MVAPVHNPYRRSGRLDAEAMVTPWAGFARIFVLRG